MNPSVGCSAVAMSASASYLIYIGRRVMSRDTCFVSLLLIFFLGISGCVGLSTGFQVLSGMQYEMSRERFGEGDYYRFTTYVKDVHDIDRNHLVGIKKLIKNNIKKVCSKNYQVIEESFTYFEGGSVSIFVRCLPV